MSDPRDSRDWTPELDVPHEFDDDVHPDRPRDEGTGVEFISFWDIARRQFRKDRTGMFALRCLIGLIVLATAAPLLCMNIPYLMRTPDGLRWPLFERLFDRLVYAGGVDIFFNLMLVLAPLWLLCGAMLKALAIDEGERRKGKALACGGALVVLAVLYTWFGVHGKSIFWHLLAFAIVGIGFQVAQVYRARAALVRARRSIRNQTRVGLWVLFTIILCLTLFWKQPIEFKNNEDEVVFAIRPMHYTSKLVIYRTQIEEMEKSGDGWALKPPIFYHPDNVGEVSEIQSLKPPSLATLNLLGTDKPGRDVLSRIVFGTRISLTIGIVAVAIYVTIGTILGSLAGYFGGWLDMLIVALLQVMICIPFMFLLLTVISLFDTRSIFLVMAVIGLIGWTGITRLVRGEFFRQRSIDYVVAAKALGIPERRIIFGHILKNAMAPVLVAAAFGVAGAILAESFLSFIGLGDPNAPSWGQILKQGRDERRNWLILSPGIAIFFVVTVLNLVGEGLRDALDPKLRQ